MRVYIVQVTTYEGGSIVSVHFTEQGAIDAIEKLQKEKWANGVEYPTWDYSEYEVE